MAKIGVGVGTGRIDVDEELRPGQAYVLPPFNVLNTGDEPANYRVLLSYNENQEELRRVQRLKSKVTQLTQSIRTTKELKN